MIEDNQTPAPVVAAQEGRTPDGKFAKGNNGMGGGRGGPMTWQDYSWRMSSLLEKYGIEQIKDIVHEIADPKKKRKFLRKLSTLDALIICQIARSFKDGKEMERMLSRLIHKSLQKVEMTGENGTPLNPPAYIIDFNGKPDEPIGE